MRDQRAVLSSKSIRGGGRRNQGQTDLVRKAREGPYVSGSFPLPEARVMHGGPGPVWVWGPCVHQRRTLGGRQQWHCGVIGSVLLVLVCDEDCEAHSFSLLAELLRDHGWFILLPSPGRVLEDDQGGLKM